MIEFSVTGDKEVAAALEKAASRSIKNVTAVIKKGANNIKDDAIKRVSGHPHIPHYPETITYDLTYGLGVIEAQIGPDKNRKTGALGNLIEYGSVKNAPLPHLGPAFREEEPRFVAALEAMVAAILDES